MEQARWPSVFSPFKGEHRDLTGCFRLVFGEKWVQLHYPGPEPLPLGTFCDDGRGVEGLGPDLDGDCGVSYQAAVPVRVGRRTDVGGDDEQAVAIGYIHHGHRAALTAPGARGREQEQGSAFPAPTGLPPVRAELLDHLAVVVVLIYHNLACCRCRLRRQLLCMVRCVLSSFILARLFDNVKVSLSQTRATQKSGRG